MTQPTQEQLGSLHCFNCNKTPEQIGEYQIMAEEYQITPELFVWQEEGTLNHETGRFCCTDCYIRIGTPSGRDGKGGPGRWTAP